MNEIRGRAGISAADRNLRDAERYGIDELLRKRHYRFCMFSNELSALRFRLAEVEKLRKHLLDSIQALEKAQSHFQRTNVEIDSKHTNETIGNWSDKITTQRGAIRQAISVMPGQFGAREIMEYLRDFHPGIHATLKPEVLGNALYKFVEEGFVKRVVAGKKGSPGVYIRGDGLAAEGARGQALNDEPVAVASPDGAKTGVAQV